MDREIKFRVWTGREMEYKIMAGYLGAFYVEGMDPNDSASMSNFNTLYWQQAPVMQFTGLLDKRQREIYEGDVIRHQHSKDSKEYMGEVYYNSEMACFFIRTSDESGFALLGQQKIIDIVGNKYASPELIKGGGK